MLNECLYWEEISQPRHHIQATLSLDTYPVPLLIPPVTWFPTHTSQTAETRLALSGLCAGSLLSAWSALLSIMPSFILPLILQILPKIMPPLRSFRLQEEPEKHFLTWVSHHLWMRGREKSLHQTQLKFGLRWLRIILENIQFLKEQFSVKNILEVNTYLWKS